MCIASIYLTHPVLSEFVHGDVDDVAEGGGGGV